MKRGSRVRDVGNMSARAKGQKERKINLEDGHKLGYGISVLHIRFPGREWGFRGCMTGRTL